METNTVSLDFPSYDKGGKALVTRAYEIAKKALEGDLRYDGSPFLSHPEGVAKIAAEEIGLPASCIAAVFLHEAMRKHPDIDSSAWGFSKEVMTMVDGLNKIATIKPKDTRLEAENYKKLIIQYSTDPRVVILKIADRLEVMRHLSMFPQLNRERKVLETLMLYIPLAHQLGLYHVKAELEDIYLRFAEPEQYRLITNKLKATERDRERLSEEFVEPLKKKLSEAGIQYKFKVRTKSAYSIYTKMKRQKVPFEEVYDVFALRFVIDCDPADHAKELALCWKVYSYVTEEYEPDTDRLRNWIDLPKPNGYESLHITVKNKAGSYVEVQIRTKRMDENAEKGNASHWSYKGIKRDEEMDGWLKSVRDNLERPIDTTSEELPQPPDKDIFVFTPSGELRILPKGATVLDFAFNIHSNIGAHCTGGRISGKAVSIKDKLATGDVVEVLTNKNQKPSADWVNFVVSSKARNKIRQCLREEEFKKAEDGKELLGRRLKNWKLEFPDEMQSEFMKKRHFDSIHAFYSAIGDGTVDVNDIKAYIQSYDEMLAEAASREAEKEAAAKKSWKGEGSTDDILVINAKDLKGLDYKMSKCCNPVYGDDVFGFVTRDAGIKVHRISCPNAARLINLYPYRIQKIRWASTPSSGSFQAALRITSDMEESVISKVTEIISQFKASVRSLNVSEDQRNGTSELTIRLAVPSNTELDKIISQVKTQKHVLKVRRA